MNNIEALDIMFNFIPKILLKQLKKEGLYEPILSGRIKDGAELYNHLSNNHILMFDPDCTEPAESLFKFMSPGNTLEIGCGQGDFLKRLANLGSNHLFGIERSEKMTTLAQKKLINYDNIDLFISDVRTFDFNNLPVIDNVLINNFWGMIDEDDSKKLLYSLKQCLNEKSLIFIGPYQEIEQTKKVKEAKNTLKDNLNFTFSFPFFKDFIPLGYNQRLISVAGMDYYLLKLTTNI